MPGPTTFELASFPNTRNKVSNATQRAIPLRIVIPASGALGTPGTPVKLLDYNASRTYFKIINLNLVNTANYDFAPLGHEGTPPADLATDGVPVYQQAGYDDQPSPQELWAVNMCDNNGAQDIIIMIEEGSSE